MSDDEPVRPGDEPPTEEPAPEDAFALVGNEIRAGILRAMGAERGGEGIRPELPFSELRDRVDADVHSSQFNYHLQQLVGNFVARTDDGYRMRHEGTTLYRAVRAGTFVRTASVDSLGVGLDCYFCGTPVEASYDDGLFAIECPGCEYPYHRSSRIPSAAVEDEGTLLSRVDRYRRHKLLAFASGVCPTCAHELDTRFVPPDEAPFQGSDRRAAYVHRSCPHCGNQDYMTVGEGLLYDPGVIAFSEEHGLGVTDVPFWELEFVATDRTLTVQSTDPWVVTLTVPADGEALELDVDGNLNVTDRRR